MIAAQLFRWRKIRVAAVTILLSLFVSDHSFAQAEQPLAPDAALSAVGLLADIKAVAAGSAHTCALTTRGGVKCWGDNTYGQLGDGTIANSRTPVDVAGLMSGVQAISAGGRHTCALTTAGGVLCWGYNDRGQLGDGSTMDRLMPVDVSGLAGVVQAIAASDWHTCALTTAGGVKCWGSNGSGQLGDGTTTDRLEPVDVNGLTSDVQMISAGRAHTCALTAAGGARCWGSNIYGQLGDGTMIGRPAPVDVGDLTSGLAAISAGGDHTCALTAGAKVKCWGRNSYGQLGDSTIIDRLTPVDVSDPGDSVRAISVGNFDTCTLTIANGVKCWGSNFYGQLGDGTRTMRLVPVDVSGLKDIVREVSGGSIHTCALTMGGGVQCWGDNSKGQLGNGSLTAHSTPTSVAGLTAGVRTVSPSRRHTCALTAAGGVKCWGVNNSGELGDGGTDDHWRPVDVMGLASGILAVATGEAHTCALTAAGGVKCWGANDEGQLGDGATDNQSTPVDVSSLMSGVQDVAAGDWHSCALTSAGGVLCWGGNDDGQLGDGTTGGSLTPVGVTDLTSGVQALSVGWRHNCALIAAGAVKCWGWNASGQLGDGATASRLTPVDVSGLSSGVQAITTGWGHTCALTTGGGVKCWGDNRFGQLGDGTTTDSLIPVDVRGLAGGVKGITAGSYHTCALMAGGGALCWGRNEGGQLGDGTTTDRLAPADVSGLTSSVQAIAAGSIHTCALTETGGVKCWGDNSDGRLGINPGWTPTDVVDPNTPAAIWNFYLPLVSR